MYIGFLFFNVTKVGRERVTFRQRERFSSQFRSNLRGNTLSRHDEQQLRSIVLPGRFVRCLSKAESF